MAKRQQGKLGKAGISQEMDQEHSKTQGDPREGIRADRRDHRDTQDSMHITWNEWVVTGLHHNGPRQQVMIKGRRGQAHEEAKIPEIAGRIQGTHGIA